MSTSVRILSCETVYLVGALGFPIHKLYVALCAHIYIWSQADTQIEFIVYRQAVKGDGILSVLYRIRGRRGAGRGTEGRRGAFCVQWCETTQGHVQEPSQHRRRILSMPRLDRLTAKALQFDSSQRPRSFLTFARRSMTDPPLLAYWLPVSFVFMLLPFV